MARDTEPKLTPDATMDEERRGRLVSFLDIVQERPGVMAAIITAYRSDSALLEAAGQVEEPAEDDFGARALRSVGDVLADDIDIEVDPDDETAERMRIRLRRADREGNLDGRRRLLRVAEFAIQVADWQASQEAVIPPPVHGYEAAE